MTNTIETLPTKNTATSGAYEDLLDRRKLAKNFVDVLKSQKANVYSINAPWGGGKTWFLKFIEDECLQEELPFIQFNVWETDYAKDPFQAILSELLNLLNQQIQKIKPKNKVEELEKDLSTIKANAENLMRLCKRLSFGFGIKPLLSPVSLDVTVNPDTSSLKEYEDMKSAKNEFIDSLKAFVSNFDTKLIIAIDELDRCRPDYAITTLEIIKHFFNIKNVIFILAVDKEQLYCTVKTMFGTTTDADAYLKKFVDIQYSLPQSNNIEFIRYLIENKYPVIRQSIAKLSKEEKILRYTQSYDDANVWMLYFYENNEDIIEIDNICESLNLSLRDIEKLCLRLSIILPQLAQNSTVLQLDFLIRLIVINIKEDKIYNKLHNLQNLTFTEDTLDNYTVGHLFGNIYRVLCDINSKPRSSYYTNAKNRAIAISHKDIKSYFSKIDFAEDFS